MNAAGPRQPELFPVWRGHRGDGEVAVRTAAAATDADLEDAMQGSHDQLIEQLGGRRAGPVTWFVFGPSQAEPLMAGLEYCRLLNLELPDGLLAFLSDNPASTLVLAMASTDRISRRTPPRRNGRRRR